MSWIDLDGVEHVSGSDVPSDWGDNHILECEPCGDRLQGVANLLRTQRRLTKD